MDATAERDNLNHTIICSADLDYDSIENQVKILLKYRKKASIDYIESTNPEAKQILMEIITYSTNHIKQLMGI
jgi:hypothetical protein